MQNSQPLPTLYYYEHCPYCIRVLTFIGLAKIPINKVVLLNDDENTPTKMVGKKIVPILATSSGDFMPESMDIIHYLSKSHNYSLAINDELRQQVEVFLSEQRINIYSLMMPRCIKLPLKEFKTQGAIDYFVNKKTATIGDFDVAIEKSKNYINGLLIAMNNSADLFEQLVKNTNSDAAIIMFSALYGISDVKNFPWPQSVKKFMQSMGDVSQQAIFNKSYQAI